jgi:hypothetical protein
MKKYVVKHTNKYGKKIFECAEGTPKGYKLRIQNTGMNIPIIIGGCLTGTAWLVVFFLVK